MIWYSPLYNILLASMTVLSLFLTVVSILAYRRSKNKKLLYVSGAFLLFLGKGLWLSYNSFIVSLSSNNDIWIPVLALDMVILVIFYFGAMKR